MSDLIPDEEFFGTWEDRARMAERTMEELQAKLAVAEKALDEIEEAKPQPTGTREVHDGKAWKQAEYFEPFEFRHARRIARAALAAIRSPVSREDFLTDVDTTRPEDKPF